jgi:hypothetical protein
MPSENGIFAGKVARAAYGIGRAAPLAFAREGANVVVLGLGDGDGAWRVASCSVDAAHCCLRTVCLRPDAHRRRSGSGSKRRILLLRADGAGFDRERRAHLARRCAGHMALWRDVDLDRRLERLGSGLHRVATRTAAHRTVRPRRGAPAAAHQEARAALERTLACAWLAHLRWRVGPGDCAWRHRPCAGSRRPRSAGDAAWYADASPS